MTRSSTRQEPSDTGPLTTLEHVWLHQAAGFALRFRCGRTFDFGTRICHRILLTGLVGEGSVRLDPLNDHESRPHIELRGDSERMQVACPCGAHWVIRSDKAAAAVAEKMRSGGFDEDRRRIDLLTTEIVGK